jgi:iron complex outermembrane receptor protein
MERNIYRSLLLVSAISGIAMSGGTTAHAQEAAAVASGNPADGNASPPATIEEVIVTAQKRSQPVTDVPMSITAASGEQLREQGIFDPSQLEDLVPGFTYRQSSYGTPIFTIRGVGLYSTSLSVAPTVSVYVDQVPLPYLAMTSAVGLDVERLEVLKGPQGILFGQNSTGGAINYIAAKPTPDPHAGFDLTYGSFNQVAGEAFVSGPITSTLTARVSVRRETQDGWQVSESRPNDRLGARDFTAARLLLDWTPTDALNFEFNVNGWRNRSDTQATQFEGFSPNRPVGGYPESAAALQNLMPAPRDPRIADWDPGVDLRRNDRFYQTSLRGDLKLNNGMTLTSITAYSHLNADVPSDVDGTDFPNFFSETVGQIGSFYQEVRLAADFGNRVNLTAGGNYQHDVIDETVHDNSIASNSGIGPDRYQYFKNIGNQRIGTWAGFASADVKVTDTVTLQGGLRYTKQDQAFNGCVSDAGDGALAKAIALVATLSGFPHPPAPAGACVTMDDESVPKTLATLPIAQKSLNQDNLSWRGDVTWKPTEDMTIYANITKGFKAGSFQPLPAIFSSQLNPVVQESVLAYETGIKVNLADGMVQFAGAAFYYDYSNKQIQGYKNFAGLGLNLPALQNIPKSSIYGAELTATLRPIRGLNISGGATYDHSRVDDSFLAPDLYGKIVDLKGEAFPATPEWQIIGNADYSVPVSGTLSAFLGGGVTYRSSTNAAFGLAPALNVDAYALVDFRAGVETLDGRWRVQVWGKNVTNQYYAVNVAHVSDTIATTTGMPATYGVTLSSRF